jgi:hypothetical protein
MIVSGICNLADCGEGGKNKNGNGEVLYELHFTYAYNFSNQLFKSITKSPSQFNNQ